MQFLPLKLLNLWCNFSIFNSQLFSHAFPLHLSIHWLISFITHYKLKLKNPRAIQLECFNIFNSFFFCYKHFSFNSARLSRRKKLFNFIKYLPSLSMHLTTFTKKVFPPSFNFPPLSLHFGLISQHFFLFFISISKPVMQSPSSSSSYLLLSPSLFIIHPQRA